MWSKEDGTPLRAILFEIGRDRVVLKDLQESGEVVDELRRYRKGQRGEKHGDGLDCRS